MGEGYEMLITNQVGFEQGPEDSYGRCGSDKIRQTVIDASSGERSPTVDSRVRLTISDEDELERSR